MTIREASGSDWEALLRFFKRIYRKDHPLHTRAFWEWQYGHAGHGRSFISLNAQGEVTGHVGAAFGGGLSWIINVYLDESCRGQGILGKLYALARQYHPLAATAANEAGLGLYRNMRWIRYHDLVRYVKTAPGWATAPVESVCQPVSINTDSFGKPGSHYFQQPGLTGIALPDGSTGVSQPEVGGLRIVDIAEPDALEPGVWEAGYRWMDYVTSWNDLKVKELEQRGWLPDYRTAVPWRLNPMEPGRYCDITFLSERPLDNEFIVHRSYSDHGRIGSIHTVA